MITIRLNALSSKEEKLDFIEKESIQETFQRAKKKFPQINDQTESFYKAYLYGHEIPRDMWPYLKPKESSALLIGIVPQSGDTGRILGQIAIVAAVAGAAYLTGGVALGGLGYGASIGAAFWAPAVAGLAASLLVGAIVKPPNVTTGGFSNGYSGEESQMYTITSQSNNINKFGIVPKVYGRHRVFPNVVANPYTEFFADESGELAQYFYCVYDLGLGQGQVSDVFIGNTPIEEYNESAYRLVDFNKPAFSEGSWDTSLNDSLLFYRGDNQTESLSVSLNENSDGGGLPASYQAVRNADDSGGGDEQQITLQFVCPNGLRTIDTSGNNNVRSIELQVEFAEVGTENWHSYNDETQIISASTIGNTVDETLFIEGELTQRATAFDRYHTNIGLISSDFISQGQYLSRTGNFVVQDQGVAFGLDVYGFKAGTNTFTSSKFINTNVNINHGNNFYAKIATRTVGGLGYIYTTYSPFPYDIAFHVEPVIIRNLGEPTENYTTYYIPEVGGFTGREKPLPKDYLKIEQLAGRFTVKASKSTPVFSSVTFRPITTNQIKVRVTRVRSFGGSTFQIFDDLTWTSINTRYDRAPITTDKRHIFLEVRIKATDQLNGAINNLNAVVHSALDVYDPNTQTWSKQITNNPAWIYADILTGEINKRAIAKSRLDTASLVEYAQFCEEIPTPPTGAFYSLPRFESNFVLDFKTTVKDAVAQVLGQCQASMNIVNGKYGVLIDKRKTVPVQVFTPRNSSDFSSSRTYTEEPDALKVSYVDAGSDWQVREQIVYTDGKDELTAETFQEIGTFGVTNDQQAWRYGRYILAQNRLRKENISITVDFENLVCTRGDFVKFTNDVMKVGGVPSRVKEIIGNDVTIDEEFIIQGGTSYGYTFRNYQGIFTGTLSNIGVDTATLSGPELPQVGDLFIYGEVDKVTIDCLVKEIQAGPNLTARLLLVEKADAIYDAESTDTLPTYNPELAPTISDIQSAPDEVENLQVTSNSFDCDGTSYVYQIGLSWEAPLNGVTDSYEIYVQTSGEFKLVDVVKGTLYTYDVNEINLGTEHTFKILAVSSNGQKLTLGEVASVFATPLSKTAPPSDVDALYINVLNETLQLTWPLISDCDVLVYEIRYSPNTTAKWESSNFLQSVDRKTNLVNVQGRTGIYFIKAVDFNGNQSANASAAITSIPSLVDLNVVDETNDFPTLLGVKDRVSIFSNELVLTETVSVPNIEFNSEGFYNYSNLLTLDDIYIVRLQSLIEAEGYTPNDLMVNWTTLASVASLGTAGTSDWFVETQYRSTNQLNVMANWLSLASIDPISEGVQENFTNWRSFTIGDFSGRIFQFRLRLVSLNPSVSPRVFEGKIKADMPDRQVSENNIIADINGETITYNPAFYGPSPAPAVAISIDDAQSGDRYEFTTKNLQGFTIQFYDSGNNKVSRQFDYIAKGYGRQATQII